METSLETATTLRDRLRRAGSSRAYAEYGVYGLDLGQELQRALQDLQISAMVGPYGVTSPPLRAQCMPSLHMPGHVCDRELCIEEGRRCPGNTHQVGQTVPRRTVLRLRGHR